MNTNPSSLPNSPETDTPASLLSRAGLIQRLRRLDQILRSVVEWLEVFLGSVVLQAKYRTMVLGVLVALLAAWVGFNQLGVFGERLHFDEVTTATVVDQIHRSNEWGSPRLGGTAYYAQPPLYLWLTSATYNLFADGPARYRAWSAIFAVGCAVLTFWAGVRWFNPLTGFFGGIVLIASKPFLFYHGARWGTVDTAVTLLIFGAFLAYDYYRARFLVRWLVIGLLLGVAGWLKVFIGVPALALLLFHTFLFETHPVPRQRWLGVVIALVACLVVSVPWYAAEWIRHGNEYFFAVFRDNMIGRLWGSAGHAEGVLYYWTEVSGFLPGCVLWLAVAWVAWKAQVPERRWPLSLLLTAGLGWLVVCSLSRDKEAWYCYPAFPALALALGYFIVTVIDYIAERLVTPVSVISWRITALVLVTVALVHPPLAQTQESVELSETALLVKRCSAQVKAGEIRLLTALDDADVRGVDSTGFYLRHGLGELTGEPASLELFSERRPTLVVISDSAKLNTFFQQPDFAARISYPIARDGKIAAFLVDANAIYDRRTKTTAKTDAAVVTMLNPISDATGSSFLGRLQLRLDMPTAATRDSKVILIVRLRLQSAPREAVPVYLKIGSIDYADQKLEPGKTAQTLTYSIPSHLITAGGISLFVDLHTAGDWIGSAPFAGEWIDARGVVSVSEIAPAQVAP